VIEVGAATPTGFCSSSTRATRGRPREPAGSPLNCDGIIVDRTLALPGYGYAVVKLAS
jgi:hypothetical protein